MKNVKYAVLLSLLGIAQIALSFSSNPFAWLLAWSGISWLLVGCAYAVGAGVGIFGKRADGSRGFANTLLLLPYLTVTYLLWWMQRTISREASCHEIAPGLWLGRRCSGKKLPDTVESIMDLTAEFAEPKRVRANRAYHCVPTLDAAAPPLAAFSQSVRTVSESIAHRKGVYVHCAKGHGRSAMLVTASLVAMGYAATLDEAEAMTAKIRPGVKINAVQRALLREWKENYDAASAQTAVL